MDNIQYLFIVGHSFRLLNNRIMLCYIMLFIYLFFRCNNVIIDNCKFVSYYNYKINLQQLFRNLLNITLRSTPIMRPKSISIPSSTNSQQITTPSWAAYTHKHPNPYPIPKMSRLDELLSRNQQIYQNMRIQLQQISKSNQKIDANINNIKPLYESQRNDSQTNNQQIKKIKNKRDSMTGNSSRQNNEIYSFNNISQQQSPSEEPQRESTHSYSYNVVNNQQHYNFDKSKKSSKSGLVTKKPKKNHSPYTNYQEYKKITNQQANSSFKQQLQINQPSVQQQKIQQQYKIKQTKNHNTNPYDQLDSSPILSQSHNTNPIYTNSSFYNKASGRQRQQFYSQDQNIQQNTSNKYHTFQEGEKEEQEHIDTLRQKIQQQQQQYQRIILKDSYKCMINSTNKKSTSTLNNVKKSQIQPTLPPRLSILFIPFNRLYSSPILQQTGPRQLILARKSKTQVVVNTSINKIVNGIKYKNVNIINDQITVYSQVINALKKVQSVLRQKRALDNQQFGNFNKDASFSTEKDSFDIGIVGGKNSLKKKIHYALIAHVYADIIEQINCYFNQSEQISFQNLVLAIDHQELYSGSEPIIMKSQGCLSSSKIENQIVYGNLNALIYQIFDTMKVKQNNFTATLSSTTNLKQQPNFHCIRVTKFILQAVDKKRNVSVTLCNTKIISTNKIQNEFINDLDLDVAIWCVNPLVKNYDQTFHALECYNQYNSKKTYNRKQTRQNINMNTPTRGWN